MTFGFMKVLQSQKISYLCQKLKNPTAIAGKVRDVGSISRSGGPRGGGHGNPLQYFCLENPMDGGAWWATVHGIAKSQTQLSADWFFIISF